MLERGIGEKANLEMIKKQLMQLSVKLNNFITSTRNQKK